MLIAIDGTGEEWVSIDLVNYYKEMKASFVSEIRYKTRIFPNRYYVGPSVVGWNDSLAIANRVVGEIGSLLRLKDQQKIFMTGYSRGAAICIQVAHRLRVWPSLKVECMALFDAVDRTTSLDTSTIPSNVIHAYHAYRDDRAGSRLYFGHCGMRAEKGVKLGMKKFYATHAAMGGLPWTGDHPVQALPRTVGEQEVPEPPEPLITPRQDEDAAKEVHRWMWDSIKKHGMI